MSDAVIQTWAAGLAFALQEVIGSIAGWTTILSGRPFIVGDRIETGGIRGDVVDISVLRTSLMEIGNWMGGDHNTGRIVTVSNAFIFKEPLFNYSQHLHYVWDEIEVPVTYESNWQQAIQIMVEAVQQHPFRFCSCRDCNCVPDCSYRAVSLSQVSRSAHA